MKSRIRFLAILISVLVLLDSCTFGEKSWKKIENDHFSFSVPESFKKTDRHGIDSFVGVYLGDGIELGFDYGAYSESFRFWPDGTQYETVKVNRKSARIGTMPKGTDREHPYYTQIHIEVTKYTALSMHALCRSEKEVELAKKIFKTIAFKEKK
ncbi:MAG TPA: hypothetical protein VG754_00560 [Verrucomicrobiae bacterium]|jgi:hypothetical protein|nr:hypothetical protein [Verrucomicrobiae bacterium]